MPQVTLPALGTATAWRDAARDLLAANVPPSRIVWSWNVPAADLFADAAPPAASGAPVTVPRAFVSMAQTVCWHRDPDRFARLYALLWRFRDSHALMADRGDADLAHLRAMEKAVHRDMHKMKAFVRFREIGASDTPRRRFAAWFEPSHHVAEPIAPFFARRFGDMDWMIATPDLTVLFEDGAIAFAPGQERPALPADATEDLWTTYFRNIFNPARLKVKAMQAEMPKKYWRNLPEADAIPDLIAGAEARARAMREAAPTLPPARAAKARAPAAKDPDMDLPLDDRPRNPVDFLRALKHCERCGLYAHATQVVPGEGPPDAPLMVVGEQPGDQEDLQGRPFVGPAGQLFDQIAQEAGLDRSRAYVTNAVKHFKYTPRGKRRIHQKPDAGEIQACKWWLETERQIVAPKLILAMGATAVASLTGRGQGILKRRGTFEKAEDGTPILLTLHPSYLLRVPDARAREQATAQFRDDLALAARKLEEMGA